MKKLHFKKIMLVLLLAVIFTGCATSTTPETKETATETTTNAHDHTKSAAALGEFEDEEVKIRPLSDWEGSWQSINQYLLDGTLDPVLEKKVKADPNGKTVEEYREYYKVGYETNVETIEIKNNIMSFSNSETTATATYKYNRFEILTYQSGKKGVRYLFDKVEGDALAPKFIQFSDHIIAPEKSGHYHIYSGNESQETLLEEMDNWPTYYPSSLDKDAILHEMLYH